MWNIPELEKIGLDFESDHNWFTYTFPPPYYVRKYGLAHSPKSYAKADTWEDISLYIHIPFCRMNCSFCNLHRIVAKHEAEIAVYLEALEKEIVSHATLFRKTRVSSVFIGGGTPSILSLDQMNHLLDEISQAYNLAEEIELCIEMAPDMHRSQSQWEKFIRSLASRTILPLNRISLGVQSFNKDTLLDMKRHGGKRSVIELLYVLDKIIPVYNIDVIIGYPEKISNIDAVKSVDLIIENICDLISQGYRLPSISVYQLWDAVTTSVMQRSRSEYIAKDDILTAKWQLQDALYQMGYNPSSTSTFIHSEQDRHQWARHRHVSFRHVAFGSGIYSILPDEIVQRTKNIDRYISTMHQKPLNHDLDICYSLTSEEVVIRGLIMGLRSNSWIEYTIDRNESEIYREFDNKIEDLIRVEAVQRDGDKIRMSKSSSMISNEISTLLHPSTYPRKE